MTTYLVAQTRTLCRVKGRLFIITPNNRCKQRPLWTNHAMCALAEARGDGEMFVCCGEGGAGLVWQVPVWGVYSGEQGAQACPPGLGPVGLLGRRAAWPDLRLGQQLWPWWGERSGGTQTRGVRPDQRSEARPEERDQTRGVRPDQRRDTDQRSEARPEERDQTRGERPDQRRETRPEEGQRPEEWGQTREERPDQRRDPDQRRETRPEERDQTRGGTQTRGERPDQRSEDRPEERDQTRGGTQTRGVRPDQRRETRPEEGHRPEERDQTRGGTQIRGWRPDQRKETRPEEGHRPEERDKTAGGTQNRGGTPDWRREPDQRCTQRLLAGCKGVFQGLGAPEVALMEGQRREGRNGWRSRSQPQSPVASAGDKQRMTSAAWQTLKSHHGANTGSWTSKGQVPSQAGNPRAESLHQGVSTGGKEESRWLTGPREACEREVQKQMGSGAGTEGGLVSHWATGVPGVFVASAS